MHSGRVTDIWPHCCCRRNPQIVRAVTTGQRPALPDPPPGGNFPGAEGYVALMQECWSQEPEERPAFSTIAARLRQLLAQCSAAGGVGGAASGSAAAAQQPSQQQ